MKKIINVILYIIIFLLVVSICVISIKKFFDKQESIKLDSIIATNFVSNFVSFNEIEEVIVVEPLNVVVEKKEEVAEEEKIETNLVVEELEEKEEVDIEKKRNSG